MASIAHAAGCPQARIESYQAKKPDGQLVTVTRCIDCGEQIVRNGVVREEAKTPIRTKGNDHE